MLLILNQGVATRPTKIKYTTITVGENDFSENTALQVLLPYKALDNFVQHFIFMIRLILNIVFILASTFSIGQTKNVFLERNYWHENPSIEKIKKDIQTGNNIAELNSNKFDAVVYAILKDVSNTTLEFLISQKGNDVNKLTHDARTYVFWAAYKNNVALMQYLINRGAKMNLVDQHGLTVANFAASNGQINPEIFQLCEKAGCILKNELNPDGANTILLAMPHIKSNESLVFFSQREMSIFDRDKNGNNAFVYAAKSGNKFMMDYLIHEKVDPKANKNAAIIFACIGTRNKKNDINTFIYLVEKGLSTGVTDTNKNTPLHLLSGNSQDLELLNYFLENGAEINAKNKKGFSPLHISIANNKKEIINFYLEKGADFSLTDNNENTILHLAAERNEPLLMQLMLTKHIDVNALNKEGLTALHISAMKSTDLEIAKLLISKGADKSIKTPFEETAYDLASENEILQETKIDLTILK